MSRKLCVSESVVAVYGCPHEIFVDMLKYTWLDRLIIGESVHDLAFEANEKPGDNPRFLLVWVERFELSAS